MTQLSDEVVERAATIRDEMIQVARRRFDHVFGATKSEMREAQIEYLARALAEQASGHAELVAALDEAIEMIQDAALTGDYGRQAFQDLKAVAVKARGGDGERDK